MKTVNELYAIVSAQARDECAQRKARVLAHPDLARRLVTELGYQRPEQWNGYVPPLIINPGASEVLTHNGTPNRNGGRSAGQQQNDSPRRAALIAICREAYKREQAETQEAP